MSEFTTEQIAAGNRELLRLAGILDKAHVEYATDASHLGGSTSKGYDQSEWYHECGTPACAYGHYVAHSPEKFDAWLGGYVYRATGHGAINEIELVSRREFALTLGEKRDLFSTEGCGYAQTAAEAAAFIRRFVAARCPTPEVKE